MHIKKIELSFFVIILFGVPLNIYLQDNKRKDGTSDGKQIVKVNLMVLDESDSFVGSVKQSEIEIFEDGLKQKVTHFAEKVPDYYVGFVVDNSGSVREHLDKITNICKMIAANLGEKDEAFVIRFVGRDKIEVEQDFTSNKKLLYDAFENFYAEGGQSAVVDAVYVTVEKLVKFEKIAPNKRFAVVLISDGEERNSFYNYKQLAALLVKSDIQIFSIGIPTNPSVPAPIFSKSNKEKAENLLTKMSYDTGGNAYIIGKKDKKEQIEAVVRSLMTELRSQYIVGYESSAGEKDNRSRNLTVVIADGPNGKKRKGVVKAQAIVL